MKEQTILMTQDHMPLSLSIYPAPKCKGVIQVIHGALEYKERYDAFARFFQEHHYTVVLSDNRGHGQSVNTKNPKGYMPKYETLIRDQYEICQSIKQTYPHVPYYLFGHSFGSILARLFLQEHDDEIDKLILTGTVRPIPLAFVGNYLASPLKRIFPKMKHSKLISKLTNDIETKDNSWISNNHQHNRQTKNDPHMLSYYPVHSNLTIWQSNAALKNKTAYRMNHPQLPILSIIGKEDTKITGGKKGLHASFSLLHQVGYSTIVSYEMPEMKHEVLNEINYIFVYETILHFLENKPRQEV